MPTDKKRINITLNKNIETVLTKVAHRDGIPAATKAAALLEFALEIEEDMAWSVLAEKRDVKNARFVAHDKAWL